MNIPLLNINNKICISIEQLRSYFNQDLNTDSTLYKELLSYGRNGVISKWLREQGEGSIADRVDKIETTFSDSDYVKNLWEVICGNTNIEKSLVLQDLVWVAT